MRNLYKPNRYNVASIQAQQTLGGDVMQADEEGQYVEFRDYAWLLAEKQRLDDLCKQLMAQHSDISCENIRLRKAGDDLSAWLTIYSKHPNCGARDEWLRAKKGLPSLAQQWEREKNNKKRAAKDGKPTDLKSTAD